MIISLFLWSLSVATPNLDSFLWLFLGDGVSWCLRANLLRLSAAFAAAGLFLVESIGWFFAAGSGKVLRLATERRLFSIKRLRWSADEARFLPAAPLLFSAAIEDVLFISLESSAKFLRLLALFWPVYRSNLLLGALALLVSYWLLSR